MRFKILLIGLLFIVVIGGVGAFALVVLPGLGRDSLVSTSTQAHNLNQHPVERLPVVPVESLALPEETNPMSLYKEVGQEGVGLPIRLNIPSINVDAAIEYVGLTPERAMDIPKSPLAVAWFDLGVRPGVIGSAVIAGHFGWKNNIPAVFDRLSQLHKGENVYVIDENGATSTFVVRELRTYKQNADAADVFDSNDGKAHLNLITCQGIWNKNKKSYSDRLVVFTTASEGKE